MGKSIILIVLGASVIIGVLILNLNANTNRGLDTTLSYYDNTQARLIANSGIEIYLEKLRRDKTLSGYFPNNDLMGGSYDVSITGPDTAMKIVSTGSFQDINHQCIVTATRDKMTLPTINSSIYVSSTNLSLNLQGNMNIDGNDHYMDGMTGTGNPALPGIGVNKTSDSAYIVNNLQPKIPAAIQGEGGPPSVRSVVDTTNWQEVTQDYIFAADITLPSGTYSSGLTLGTQTDPKITYVSGDVHFSDVTGYGILVVNGNLNLSGNFTFKGLVIVYGQSQIVTQTTGNSAIYGASIFVGQSIDFKASGNATFYYSKQALDNAKANLKSSRFLITSWLE